MRVCSKPGCPTIYEGTASRCDVHETQGKRAHWAKTTAYNTKWHKAFRAAVLRRDPLCVIDYLAQSTIADHYPRSRVELIEQGLDPNDAQYGRGLCKTHHDRETAAHQPGGWNNRD